MKIFTPLFLLLFLSANVTFGQGINGITLLDQWENPDLPDAGNFSYNEVWGYTDCNGNEYGIFGSSAFIHFFDVTDPANIVHIDSFAGGSTTVWRDMKTYENFAYSVCDSCDEGLMVFDLSGLPEAVTLVQQNTDFFGRSHNIFVDEEQGRLYAVGTNTNSGGIHIFDLTDDPGNPVLLSEPELPGGYVHDINVVNNIAYASSGNNGLYVYDFTDPVNFTTLGTLTEYPEQGYNHSSWPTADGTTLIMADETHDRGLKTLDISDLSDITVQDVFRSEISAPEITGSIAHNPFIRGNYAFVSYYHDGLQVFDLSDPENVVQVAGYDTETDHDSYAGFTGLWGAYPYLPSGTILGSDTHNGFFTFSVDNLDLADSPAALFPADATLTAQSSTTICEGQSVSLFVAPGAENYEFFLDDESIAVSDLNTFAATDAGIYSATAGNGYCVLTSEETVEVSVTAYPLADLTAPEDAFICGDETETLTVTDGADGYIWYLDGMQLTSVSGSEIEAEIPGVYTVTAINNGCIAESAELQVDALAAEDFPMILPGDTEACLGEILILTASGGFENLQWTLDGEDIPDATGESIEVSETGSYAVSAMLTEFCRPTSESVTPTFNEPVIPTINQNLNVLQASNAATWQWFLDGEIIADATGQSYTALVSGTYSVGTTDANGCTAVSENVSVVISGLHEIETGSVLIFPNPVSDNLEIRLDVNAQNAAYRVYDVTGKTVAAAQNVPAAGSLYVDFSDRASGLYFVEISLDGAAVVTEKVVKK